MKVKSLIETICISPIGGLKIAVSPNGLKELKFVDNKDDMSPAFEGKTMEVIYHLGEYFAGKRHGFEIELDLEGTHFQKAVWNEMMNIPFGQTRTYGEIANNIGYPNAARAVGMACNRNPVNIIVPCHRVVGRNGDLTGYAGGILKKQWLLRHEGCI